jgi:hypothetical protein
MQRTRWGLLTIITMLAVGALVIGGQNTQARSNPPVWGLVANVIPTTSKLTNVFMLDENNAWVAGSDGSRGKVYKLQVAGGNWRLVDSHDFPSPVLSLAAVSDNNVWVVGDTGLLAHKDANGWHSVANPVPTGTLTTIQMFGTGAEGWAGGFTLIPGTPGTEDWLPVLLHYINGSWQFDPSISSASGPGSIQGIHFTPSAGWAVGGKRIWRYDGGRWVEEAEPGPQDTWCGDGLSSVRALNSGEAWAIGSVVCTNIGGPSFPTMVVLHRIGGTWHRIFPGAGLLGDPLPYSAWGLSGISFTSDGYGLAVGMQALLYFGSFPMIISYHTNGQWYNERLPYLPGGALNAVSQADARHALAVGDNGAILSYGYNSTAPEPWPTPASGPVSTPIPTPPTARVEDPHNLLVTYFPVVGHTLRGGFRDYWNSHGGLAQFGYPIAEEFREASHTDGKSYIVQYFERARFEWHPENRPPFDVLLGLLGRTITQGRENEPPFRPAPPQTTPGYTYFRPTGHNLAPEFAPYWKTHGGLPVYGYPISEAFNEISPTDGKSHLVQYVERNRLEYHPELPEAYRVSLGLLGAEILRQRGWIQ